MAAYVSGDENAYARLVERHLKSVYTFALRFTEDMGEAEDIAQESFLKAWKHMRRFDSRKSRFKTWLMRIVRNTAIDHARKRKNIPFSMLANENESDFGSTIPDDAPLLDEVAARKDDARSLEAALQKLTLAHREILLLYNGNDFTFEEIAAILGTSLNTVKSRYHRALQAIRNTLVHQNEWEPRT